MAQIEVLGFGALNLDYLYQVPEIVLEGETVVESVTVAPGGSAANTCRALAQWGVRTSFLGAVGDDPDGGAMLAGLRKSGVDVSQVVIKPDAPTSRVIGLVDPHGHRSLYVEPGANDLLNEDDLDLKAIGQARLVHLASFASERQLTLQEWVVEHLPPQVTVSFSPGQIYARLGWERLAKILRRTAILFVNETEAEWLGGVESLRRCGCEIAVETLGARGGRVIHAGGSFRVPGFSTEVVDTTGAGDAFAAGFLLGWLREKSLETCARWGNWAASCVIREAGANSTLPTVDELEALA
ncbi:MAG: carbohydrate kinase family protein [Chloroflexota bacterium]|nr:carbohydrate kinase family protein [Chloroflexota bacterium]